MTSTARRNRPATIADLLAIPEAERFHKVVDGELVRKAMLTIRHGAAQAALGDEVGVAYGPRSRGRGPGRGSSPRRPRANSRHQVYRPDMAAWRRGHMPRLPDAFALEIRPDRVGEVRGRALRERNNLGAPRPMGPGGSGDMETKQRPDGHRRFGGVRVGWGLGLLLASGCAGDEKSVGLFGDGGTVDSGATVGSASNSGVDSGAATSGSVSDTGPSGDTEPKFDVGDGTDTAADDGGLGEGCEKIDFLFVVDNSGSMGAHQSRLINSFGPFMDTIFATVQAQDYHVMVVDSDAGEDISGACEPCSPDSFWCDDWCTVKNNLDVACETTLGAGEVAPYNNEASNQDCGVPGGVRYLTSDLPEADIKSKFACMAKVGIFGSSAEKPLSAMVEAVGSQSQAGGCNEGFLRDDAVLVVTVITDDYPVDGTPDDASTVGTAQQWYDAVVQAKGGNPDHVVMLGIFNLETSSCVQDGTAGGPLVQPTQKFIDFVDLFGMRGIVGDVCSNPDYNAFFQMAVELIDTTCDEFVPEG